MHRSPSTGCESTFDWNSSVISFIGDSEMHVPHWSHAIGSTCGFGTVRRSSESETTLPKTPHRPHPRFNRSGRVPNARPGLRHDSCSARAAVKR